MRPELWRRMDPAPALAPASSESESPVSSQCPVFRPPPPPEHITSCVMSPAPDIHLSLSGNQSNILGSF